MSIGAKTVLLNGMERRLSVLLTASDMTKVLSELSDELAQFAVEQCETESTGNDDLFDAYLGALTVQGRSKKTIERYDYLIKKLLSHVKVMTNNVTVYHIRQYLADRKKRGISDRTLDGERQVFSAYFGWLKREGLIEKDPTANLGAVKYQKKQKDIFSDADIELMKFACKGIRDRAIVCFLQATGCRISEVTQLNREDVDFTTHEVKVLGKGNKERIVFLDQVAVMTLRKYFKSRTDDSSALFVGKASDRIQPPAIRRMLKLLESETGVLHIHPHKFRRTLATNLIKRGMPIQEVAAILGHDKIDTTMEYVVLDKSEIKHAYNKYA